jgi:hypothetical protein
MGTSAEYGDYERVIDRSGDIDQRPLEERTGKESANAISFHLPALQNRQPQHAIQPCRQPLSLPRQEPQNQQMASLARRLQMDLDKQYARARSQLEALTQKIEAQEKRCLPPKLDGDLQQIQFQRQKILIANGPALADCLREEKSRLADLESFKAANRLARDAHYPSSPMLAFGILSILVLLEAGINGVLFADSSDQGLFGGWLEAIVLSVANVGAAFLFGRLVLPQLHRRSLLAKTGALSLSLVGVAALISINLVGAHYRDFKTAVANLEAPSLAALRIAAPPGAQKTASAAKPAKAVPAETSAPQQAQVPEKEKAKEREAIAKLFANPFALDSFMSFFLFAIGICAASIAALDGYKFDDPFPGYGKRHRKYAAARAQSTQALRRILSQSNAIMTGSFQAIGRKIENFAQEMSALLSFHHAYSGDHKAFQDGLEEAAREAEDEIAAYGRLINKVPGGETREIHSIAFKQLPALGEKHIKFYETQEKKLKALQKNAQKEQADVLGIFEEATADFQKLLAGASKSSLQAAFAHPLGMGDGEVP